MLSGDSASVFLYYNILVNFSFYSVYYFKRHQLQRVCVCRPHRCACMAFICNVCVFPCLTRAAPHVNEAVLSVLNVSSPEAGCSTN